MIVEGERAIAQTGQAFCPAFGMFVEPRSFVTHQHSGARTGPTLLDGQMPDQAAPSNCVLDVLNAHTASLVDRGLKAGHRVWAAGRSPLTSRHI